MVAFVTFGSPEVTVGYIYVFSYSTVLRILIFHVILFNCTICQMHDKASKKNTKPP